LPHAATEPTPTAAPTSTRLRKSLRRGCKHEEGTTGDGHGQKR